MTSIAVSTIGFTQTTAEDFFQRLLRVGVKKVIDVRLHRTSQLSGFAKADDLAFFLKRIGSIEYEHQPLLAPTDDILKAFKKQKGDWTEYQGRFLDLLEQRAVDRRFKPDSFEGACLLCSEKTPHHCHRRLVCEYLNGRWGNVLHVHHL
jgi:uncharacterized protein (DUF488 family)